MIVASHDNLRLRLQRALQNTIVVWVAAIANPLTWLNSVCNRTNIAHPKIGFLLRPAQFLPEDAFNLACDCISNCDLKNTVFG